MENRALQTRVMMKYSFFLLFVLFAQHQLVAQTVYENDNCVGYGTTNPWNTIWDFTSMKQDKVTGLNIGGGGYFKGMLEYLPDDYDPGNTAIKHPLIIFFHGGDSRGEGGRTDLCKLFKGGGSDQATHLSLPGRVERYNTDDLTQVYNGNTYEYIVVSPQFTVYTRNYPVGATEEPPGNIYPTADHVERVIDFLEARYGDKLDKSRIYLTGYSNGANMITEYVGSSVERAQRVAAIMPVSLCSDMTHFSNAGRTGYNIGAAQLKTWFVNCVSDYPCSISVPQTWVNSIRTAPGYIEPRFTILNNSHANPLYKCSDSLPHDAWSRAYDANFKESYVNGNGANDNVNLNMYEWFIRQTNVPLPVKLKSFSARLVNDRVEVQWVTTDEQNNELFTIERAGPDQKFAPIGTVPGAINHTGEKTYGFVDDNPLPELSFYRLKQTDIDGKFTYFDIRKVLNPRNKQFSVIVSPNPFVSDLSVFVSVQSPQRVTISLTDMTGKVLRSTTHSYSHGGAELKISAAGLPSGIYFLKAAGESFHLTQKVVKK